MVIIWNAQVRLYSLKHISLQHLDCLTRAINHTWSSAAAPCSFVNERILFHCWFYAQLSWELQILYVYLTLNSKRLLLNDQHLHDIMSMSKKTPSFHCNINNDELLAQTSHQHMLYLLPHTASGETKKSQVLHLSPTYPVSHIYMQANT